MLDIDATIPQKYPFIKIETLVNLDERIAKWPNKNTKQVVSFANINPEDFVDGDEASKIAQYANQELAGIVANHPKYFEAGVGMLAMNNFPASLKILENIEKSPYLVGAQIFTRHLGKSIEICFSHIKKASIIRRSQPFTQCFILLKDSPEAGSVFRTKPCFLWCHDITFCFITLE